MTTNTTPPVEFYATDGRRLDARGFDGDISECDWYCPALKHLIIGVDDARIAAIVALLQDTATPVIERDDNGDWRTTGRIQDFCGLSGGGHEMNMCEFEDTTAREPSAWNESRSGGVPTFATWEEPNDADDTDDDDA